LLCAILLAACSSNVKSSADAGETVAVDAAPTSECQDTQSDPANCGSCGRTCIIPNAVAACVEGECAIGACDDGYYDGDGEVSTGCEAEGEACAGAAEVCNAADDNCNDQCDEGAGCRQGIHRAYGNGHLYTPDLAAAQAHGLESENYFWTYQASAEGLTEAYLCLKGNGRHFLTASADCEGAGSAVTSIGFWATAELCGATPLYRLYNSGTGNHFYTTSASERDLAVSMYGYTFETIAGYVFTTP
jgi:hypothetical protein